MRIQSKWIAILMILGLYSQIAHADSRTFSVEIRSADIRDVLRMLAQLDGKNVVIPDNLDTKVTASFESTALEDALQSILKANGLGASIENNIIHVATTSTLKEQGGDLVTATVRLRFTTTAVVLPQVSALVSARGSAVADERTNAITIKDTPSHVSNIREFLQKVDIQDRRVLIEAKIVAASTDFIRNLGVQWGVNKATGDVTFGGTTAVGTADSGRRLNLGAPVKGKGGTAPAFGGALTIGSVTGAVVDAQLTAAEEKGDVNVLSRPSISTMNNQPAEIHSGTKFYVKTSGSVNIGATPGTGAPVGGTGLQQIDSGITLKVIPQITIDEHINLGINVSESQPDFSKAIEGIPAVTDNTASTRVMLEDGEMTVIGGLMQVRQEEGRRGLPFLMNLPILGGLFQSFSSGKSKNELLIFIKPTIVREALTQLPDWPSEKSQGSKSFDEK